MAKAEMERRKNGWRPEMRRNYRRPRPAVGHVICGECEHVCRRQVSGRLECDLDRGLVGRFHTCDAAVRS